MLRMLRMLRSCQLESLSPPLPEDQRGADGSATDSSIGRRGTIITTYTIVATSYVQPSPHTQPYIYNKRTTYTIITYTCIHIFPFLYQIFGYNRHHMCTCVFVLQFCGICSRLPRIYNRVLKNHRNTMFSGGVVFFLRLMYKKTKKKMCQRLEPLM